MRDHIAGVLREHLQQAILLGREYNPRAFVKNSTRRKIDRERPKLHDRFARAPRAWRRNAVRARASNSAMLNGLTT